MTAIGTAASVWHKTVFKILSTSTSMYYSNQIMCSD